MSTPAQVSNQPISVTPTHKSTPTEATVEDFSDEMREAMNVSSIPVLKYLLTVISIQSTSESPTAPPPLPSSSLPRHSSPLSARRPPSQADQLTAASKPVPRFDVPQTAPLPSEPPFRGSALIIPHRTSTHLQPSSTQPSAPQARHYSQGSPIQPSLGTQGPRSSADPPVTSGALPNESRVCSSH